MKTRLFQIAAAIAGVLAFQACAGKGGDAPTIPLSKAHIGVFQMHNVRADRFGLVGKKTLILTFDDGPQRGVTEKVLDYVRDEGIKVGFFLEGRFVDGNEDLLMRMRDEGHTIGNHTWDHEGLRGLGAQDMKLVYDEISSTDVKIAPFRST